jgi:hypothetical protein
MIILLILTLTVLAGAVGGLGILDLLHARLIMRLQPVQVLTRDPRRSRE